jgi:hypothetical protein
MKRCLVCHHMSANEKPACEKCGEASWSWVVDVARSAPAPAKKAAKKKATKATSAEEVSPAISDEEFAAELASAAESDLLDLLADESLSADWQKLVEAEIAKRA